MIYIDLNISCEEAPEEQGNSIFSLNLLCIYLPILDRYDNILYIHMYVSKYYDLFDILDF